MKELIRAATTPIHANITLPGSKSMTNRALLLAALADGVSEISGILLSEDTRAFLDALRHLGIIIQLDEANHSCIIGGGSGRFPKKEASIWCADAGTAARFLLAAAASMPGIYHFDGSEQLRKRPIAPLLKTLCMQGARILSENTSHMPFTLQGVPGLQGGDIDIDASKSGQFISALLMAAPFAQTPMTITAHDLVSHPFIDMTCAMMAQFGVLVRRLHHLKFHIPTPQRYVARDYTIEPDLTTASYFFAAAAVTNGSITLPLINRHTTLQGDIKFLQLLEKMGCSVSQTETELTVKGTDTLEGISVDMNDCSDTFMTLAAIAPFAKTPTRITHIAHTRAQESDRISVMKQQLEKIGIKAEEGEDWIRIYPGTPQIGVIDSHHDHRIAMSFSLIGLKVPGIEIDHAECVAKTCPDFFERWRKLSTAY